MRIGLIAMSGVRVRNAELASLGVTLPQFVSRGKVIASLPSLGLLTVAGLTPPDCDVAYREIADLDARRRARAVRSRRHLVVHRADRRGVRAGRSLSRGRRAGRARRASRVADARRSRRHADAIVLYGAEGAWPRVVADARAGRLQPRYEGLRARVFDDAHYVMPRFDLLAGRPYNRMTVQTSRGCPLNCEFCAASIRITSSYQQKPVANVDSRDSTRRSPSAREPFFELADDNTFVNKKWGKDFLRAIAPLDVRWFTETDISIADDEELLDLLAESGCRQVLIGLESPDASGLDGMDPRELEAAARRPLSRRDRSHPVPRHHRQRLLHPRARQPHAGDLRDRARLRAPRPGCSRSRSPCRRRSPARRSTRVCSARAVCSPSATGTAARSST